MARMYKAPFENIAFGAAANRCLFHLVAPADRKIIIHAFSITSDYTTDERARLQLRTYTTAHSGGTQVAAADIWKCDQDNGNNAEATFHHSGTTNITPGTTGKNGPSWRWSQQGELLYVPTPEMRDATSVGQRIGLELLAALGAARNWSGWVCWEEQ